MESYTIVIVLQSASGTYTKTLVFDNAQDAERAKAVLIKQIEKVG